MSAFLVAVAQNKERIVEGLKNELSGLLQKNMEKRGVPEVSKQRQLFRVK